MAKDALAYEWVNVGNSVDHEVYQSTYLIDGEYVKVGEVSGHPDSGYFAHYAHWEENTCHHRKHKFEAKKLVEDKLNEVLAYRAKSKTPRFDNQAWVKARKDYLAREQSTIDKEKARRAELLEVEF